MTGWAIPGNTKKLNSLKYIPMYFSDTSLYTAVITRRQQLSLMRTYFFRYVRVSYDYLPVRVARTYRMRLCQEHVHNKNCPLITAEL